MNVEERILILTPTGRDSELIAGSLQRANVSCRTCHSWAELEREYRIGAAAILVSEEALDSAGARRLQGLLQEQPAFETRVTEYQIGASLEWD